MYKPSTDFIKALLKVTSLRNRNNLDQCNKEKKNNRGNCKTEANARHPGNMLDISNTFVFFLEFINDALALKSPYFLKIVNHLLRT